jgi:hypothetical protein
MLEWDFYWELPKLKVCNKQSNVRNCILLYTSALALILQCVARALLSHGKHVGHSSGGSKSTLHCNSEQQQSPQNKPARR